MAKKPISALIHPGVGFRIQAEIARPSKSLIESFRAFDSPDISDQLNRLYALESEIHCLTLPHHTLVGPVCTVKVYPGDNLMVHKVLDVAQPGDAVMIDAHTSATNAVLGGLISMKARARKIAGFVVDGFIRDLPEIKQLDFPVFARGATPIGPLHRGPGEINYPICCGGVVVNPGDIVVADQAGVVIVPQEHAAEIIARLNSFRDRNRQYFTDLKRGKFSNEWVDDILRSTGCVVTDNIDLSQDKPQPKPTKHAAQRQARKSTRRRR